MGTNAPDFPDEWAARIACDEAAIAEREGNFAVGCVLVRGNSVLARGHNEVFFPRFASDRHAEMVAIDRFEERHHDEIMNDIVLVTTVEPCPMCLARIITSGICVVRYVTPDDEGGMVQRLSQLPIAWQRLARGKDFGLANCSAELRRVASEMFFASVRALDDKLRKRV
jgi:tRNA(adenine34) deaminase